MQSMCQTSLGFLWPASFSPLAGNRIGHCYFCFVTAVHQTGCQAYVVGEVIQGWIDIREYVDGVPYAFLLYSEFYQNRVSVYPRYNFLKSWF